MDATTFDQLTVDSSVLGQAASYLVDGASVVLELHDGELVGVELPAAVELTVAETEPGVQGDRVSGARKPATLETGLVVQVPLFVSTGERVKVDTRSGEYLTRVSGQGS
jgi:elongation factor P